MDFDRDQLLAIASQRTGKTDFGPPAFLEGLDVLLASLREDRLLSRDARDSVQERLLAPLVQRLQLYADRAAYPEIAAQRIEQPLVVMGLPRSGTTILHALLAQDPEALSLLPWQITQPSPPPRRETIDSDPRIAATEAAMAGIPLDYQRLHMIGARMPEECNYVTQLAFCTSQFIAHWDLPAYRSWYMANDSRAAFAAHRDLLQHLQAFTGGKRWVLKSPAHLLHMDALIETYPDARIIFTHRDPAQLLASKASLITFLRRRLDPGADQRKIGREYFDFWAEAIERAIAFRADPGQADRFIDIAYADVIADPMAAVRRIYARFGIPLTEAAEEAMLRFLANQPKDKHGAHRYTLEEAGLTRADIQEKFGAYIDRYLTKDAAVTA